MASRRLVPFGFCAWPFQPWHSRKIARASGSTKLFNTVKLKLKDGKQVVGGTVSSSDPDIYCAMARGWL